MEIWDPKSGGNMYSDFKMKFEAFPKVHFRQAIYCFEAQEVRNSKLQMMCKLEVNKEVMHI